MVMPKEDRRLSILEFLADTGMALTPAAIYLNMDPTFSERTTKRLLYEMRDEELVEVLDRPGNYYQITGDGRKYLEESKSGT